MINIRNTLIFLVLILGFKSSYSQSNSWKKLPSYTTVIEKFFTVYSIGELDPNLLEFEKRKEGWMVCTKEYTFNKYHSKELFWSAENNEFLPINFPAVDSTSNPKELINKFSKSYEADKFAINPYYNYVGWDADVIELLEGKNKLSDTLLYALARAYSSFATGLISRQTGFADTTLTFILPYGENSMTESQISEYLKYQHLSIKNFNKLANQNPHFKTIIGSIHDKASSEYITTFYNLLIMQNEAVAKKELVTGLYSDFIINTAKQYLISCEKNAILFTYGDMDTYPLLYVQEQYNFRQDVKVINLSLLNIDRYIDFIQRNTMGSEGVKISLNSEEYYGELNKLVYIIDSNGTNIINAKELIYKINTKDKKLRPSYIIGSNVLICPAKNYILEVNKPVILSEFYNHNLTYDDLPDAIYLKFPSQNLTLSNLILLDILATNDWKRPIYFSNSMPSVDYLGLEDYLQLTGNTYKLTPLKASKTEEYIIGSVNIDILYDNLMFNFDWIPITSSNKADNSGELHFASYSFLSFARLASALIDRGDSVKAEKVAEKCLNLYPNEIMPYSYYTLTLAESFYRLKNFSQASSIILDIFNKSMKKLKVEMEKNIIIDLNNPDVRFLIVEIYFSYSLAEKYEDKKLLSAMNENGYQDMLLYWMSQ